MRTLSFIRTTSVLTSAAIASLLMTGCGLTGGTGTTTAGSGAGSGTFTVRGNVHGGQQPIGGASLKMYAVGTTGYGSAAVSVLNGGVTIVSSSDGSGSFSLTGQYTCSAEQRVYLTATGGNAGAGTNNAIGLMAALGRCGDLTSSTFISINEVTTVASVWALAPFMSGIANIGAPVSNTLGINNAFTDVNTLASISHGTAGGDSLPAGTTIPVAAINTLADILASCINSSGANSSACTSLFTGATTGGVAPTDTVAAAMNIAQHPAVGVATLYPLTGGTGAPFQPTLAEQPSDFTLAATFTNANFTTPSNMAVDASGQAWVTDSTTNKLTVLAHNGAVASTTSGFNAPSAVAVDQAGNGWVANGGNSSLAKVSAAGAIAGTFTGGGLSTPKSVSIDGQGNVWIGNGGSNVVSEFNTNGVALSATGYASPNGTPIGIGLNPN